MIPILYTMYKASSTSYQVSDLLFVRMFLTCKVQIGTPGQTVDLQLDTGSSDTYV